MANTNIQFSEEISNLTPEEKDWCVERLSHLDALFEGNFGERSGTEPRPEDAPYDRDHTQLGFSTRFSNGSLYLHDDEGVVEHAAQFVSEFLEKFRPTETFSITYAVTASRLQPGAFTGGAAFITAKEILWHDASDWVRDQAERHKPRTDAPTKSECAGFALKAVEAFVGRTGLDTDADGLEICVTDLLADLMHLCDAQEVSFAGALDSAERHYSEELIEQCSVEGCDCPPDNPRNQH